jgi:DNA-directed RNA polymerase alpha subunit
MTCDEAAGTDVLDLSLDNFGISTRLRNCLDNEGITTLRQVVVMSDQELLRIQNFGIHSLRELKQLIHEEAHISLNAVSAKTPRTIEERLERIEVLLAILVGRL